MTNVEVRLLPSVDADVEILRGSLNERAMMLSADEINFLLAAIALALRSMKQVCRKVAGQRPKSKRTDPGPTVLIVKSPTIDLKVYISPQVAAGEILECLRPVLRETE